MRSNLPFKSFGALFAVIWAFAAIMSLTAMGCIVYILYRVATHPW